MKKIALLLVVMSLAACSQKPEVACGGDDAKSVIALVLKDSLIKKISSDFASQSSSVNYGVDGASIRATVEKISIAIEDVVTTKSDPNSTKKFCSSTLKLGVPDDVVKNADATRAMLSLTSSQQDALRANVDFDADTVKAPFDYSVQPTDDGKKIYGSTGDSNPALTFATTLVEQSFIKTALEKQKADQTQQQQQQALQAQQREAEIDQAQMAENQAALQKAQSDLKAANDAINVVWNAANKQWRQDMLPEQRLWLAQRDNQCKLKALDTGASGSASFETNRINCQVEMTTARTEVLKTSVLQSLSQSANSDSGSAGNSTSENPGATQLAANLSTFISNIAQNKGQIDRLDQQILSIQAKLNQDSRADVLDDYEKIIRLSSQAKELLLANQKYLSAMEPLAKELSDRGVKPALSLDEINENMATGTSKIQQWNGFILNMQMALQKSAGASQRAF